MDLNECQCEFSSVSACVCYYPRLGQSNKCVMYVIIGLYLVMVNDAQESRCAVHPPTRMLLSSSASVFYGKLQNFLCSLSAVLSHPDLLPRTHTPASSQNICLQLLFVEWFPTYLVYISSLIITILMAWGSIARAPRIIRLIIFVGASARHYNSISTSLHKHAHNHYDSIKSPIRHKAKCLYRIVRPLRIYHLKKLTLEQRAAILAIFSLEGEEWWYNRFFLFNSSPPPHLSRPLPCFLGCLCTFFDVLLGHTTFSYAYIHVFYAICASALLVSCWDIGGVSSFFFFFFSFFFFFPSLGRYTCSLCLSHLKSVISCIVFALYFQCI